LRAVGGLFPDLPLATPVAVLLALVPALDRWWRGRSLVPLADDSAFPERLYAYRQRGGRSFGVAFALLLVLFTNTLLWSLPLLMFSCMAANFRFRRTIYRETWSLGGYLSFIVRAIVAIFGFWLLLIVLPILADLAGSRDWMVALALAVVLLAWNARSTDSVRFLLQTKAIQNPPLVARFVALAQASTAGLPLFEQVPLRGGAIANAIAVPSLRRPAVLFTDTLLARLDEEEIVAIAGHELAHVEYFNRQRMRRINTVNLLLIAGSLVTVALERMLAGSFASPAIFWPCVVIGTLAWRVRDRQKHETESDLRAVALTGNPEALARALIKIHAFAHVPRRMDAEHEQHASHPSLARRIKAIRAAAPGTPPIAGTPAPFVSPDGRLQVTFGERHLEWREGETALHSLSYAHLTELRLGAVSPSSMHLLIVERSGQRWTIPIADADVARAQAALDSVDCQLGDATPSAPGTWPVLERVFTLLAVSFAVMAGQMATVVLALLALFRPAAPLVAAAGAAMVAGAGLTLRQPDWPGLEMQPWVSLGLAAFGALLLRSAWKTRGGVSQKMVNRLVAGIGVLGALVLAMALSEGFDVIHLHQSARSLPAVVVLPIAFAAALLCHSGPRARVGATTALIVGLTMATVGAVPFLDRFGTDPLLLPSQTMTDVRIGGAPAREVMLPFFANNLQLSPNAVALSSHDMSDNRYREDQPTTFHVGRIGHPLILTPVMADDVLFVDDERLLTFDQKEDGVELAERTLVQLDAPTWRHKVPDVFDARVSLDRASRRWAIVGWDRERKITRVQGTIGTPDIDVTRWSSPVEAPDWSTSVAASGDHALLVETRYDLTTLNALAIKRALTLLSPGTTSSRLWQLAKDRTRDLGTSVLATECFAGGLGDVGVVCTAHDGTRTRIVTLDAATGAITAIGAFDGRFTSDHHSPSGWLTGWCDSTPCAMRLTTRELMTLADRYQSVLGFTTSDRWLGVIAVDGTRSRLTLFPLSN
jgi:heat shock protein HtpX